MKYYCYILFSKKLDRFYTGFTTVSPEDRLERHLHNYYGKMKYTSKADDWSLFIAIDCETRGMAIAIEKHIKKMKSKKYCANLNKYPEIIEKLKLMYCNS